MNTPRLPKEHEETIDPEEDTIDSDWDEVRTDDTYELYNLPVDEY